MGTTEIQIILSQLELHGAKLDRVSDSCANLSADVATLVERSEHLATREDVSTAIQTHVAACKASRAPTPQRYDTPTALRCQSGGRYLSTAIKVAAILAGAVATAVATWAGFAN